MGADTAAGDAARVEATTDGSGSRRDKPRALLSAYDKTGMVDLGRELVALGWELVSSGGTAAVLADAGIDVIPTGELTGFAELIGHRVVTLHPAVHAGILADRDQPSHLDDLRAQDIEPIDLVAVNLYPFASDPSVELIDIGGPAMVRAAAKNHDHVTVLVDPADYGPVLAELREAGLVSAAMRRRLARRAFAHTAAYDAAIVGWLDATDPEVVGSGRPETGGDPSGDSLSDPSQTRRLPPTFHLAATKVADLRYGENPHQLAARYRLPEGGAWDTVVQHQGKEMSYLNVVDADAAWRLVWSLGTDPAAVVIKHANPCGAAVAADILTAYRQAHEGDPVSAFGGIVALNRPLTTEVAQALAPVFTEVVIAPAFEAGALDVLGAKVNLRVLEAAPPSDDGWDIRRIDGGLLVQTPDRFVSTRSDWRCVTRREPTEGEWRDLDLAWRLAARVTSNTIVLVSDGQAVGIGAGQQNRRDAGRIAAEKAAGRAVGGACASDAFFPFRDGLDAAAEAGATAVIQPGGSIRDDEVIAAADEAGMAMVCTGERHFRH